MNKLLIPAFLVLISCVNEGIEGDTPEICPAHAPVYTHLTVEFLLDSPNPAVPVLEIAGQEIDYCYSNDIKPVCLYNLSVIPNKLTYRIAVKDYDANVSVDLYDGTARRLSRTTEVMTTFITDSTSCGATVGYNLKIEE